MSVPNDVPEQVHVPSSVMLLSTSSRTSKNGLSLKKYVGAADPKSHLVPLFVCGRLTGEAYEAVGVDLLRPTGWYSSSYLIVCAHS